MEVEGGEQESRPVLVVSLLDDIPNPIQDMDLFGLGVVGAEVLADGV